MDRNKDDTFWTMCGGCTFQYRFIKTYLNHALMCLHCRRPFVARETAPPPNFGNLSILPSMEVHREHKQAPVVTASRISVLSQLEIRQMMMARATRELRGMLNRWESSDPIVRARKKQRA